jgi:hypothetical protein
MSKIIIAGTAWHVPEPEEIGLSMVEAGFQITEVVSSGEVGASAAGREWAWRHDLLLLVFNPDPTKPKRNAEMANYADGLLAWWDGRSKEVGDLVARMISLNKPVWIEMLQPIPEEDGPED